LQQISAVRPEIDALMSVITASEMMGSPLPPDQYSVVQFPHQPGQHWAALDLPGAGANPHLAIAILGQFDASGWLAGLYCDGWTDIIPSPTEITGMAFHYDVPAARPPQAVLLAVPPDLSSPVWSFDKLFNTVTDTLELAKIRLVGPREIPALGAGLLPAIYLPEDETKQNPTVGTKFWLIKDSYIIGKEQLFANQ
jgi:hypothetical protein